MVKNKWQRGEAGLVQSLPALLLWFQSAFLPEIPEGLSEGLESSAWRQSSGMTTKYVPGPQSVLPASDTVTPDVVCCCPNNWAYYLLYELEPDLSQPTAGSKSPFKVLPNSWSLSISASDIVLETTVTSVQVPRCNVRLYRAKIQFHFLTLLEISKPARGRETTGDREYRKRQPLPCPQCPCHHPVAQSLGPLTALPQPGYGGSSLHFLGKSWWKPHVFKKIKEEKQKTPHLEKS